MKASTILFIVLFIAGFLAIFSSFGNDLNQHYVNNTINQSQWETRYDYSNSINTSIGKLKSNFDTITDTDRSWFTRIGAGIVAIPFAVILFPLAIFDGFASFGNILTNISTDFNTPQKLIGIILIGLITFAVVKLLEFFQRSPA